MLPFVPFAVPQPLTIRGPFTAIAVDAQRRRVFAAGATAVAVLDADSGKLLATVRIDSPLSLAVEPLGGHVFAGTGDGQVREIDPDRKTIVRSVGVAGSIDVLLYDSGTGRLYAGTRGALETIDSRSFAVTGAVALPGDELTQLVPDPVTRDIYASFADRPLIAALDPQRGAVRATFPTPGVTGARAVRFDSALGEIVVAGTNGDLEVYDRAGTPLGGMPVPADIAACDLDPGRHVLACSRPGRRDVRATTAGDFPEPDLGDPV